MIEPPLPFGNAAGRWFYVLLKGLVERGHRVNAFATCSNPADMAEAEALFPSPAFDLRCYPHGNRRGVKFKLETLLRPYSYMFSDEMRADLRRTLAGGFDVLHLEQLWSGWLGLQHADRALPNVHYLFSIDQSHARPRGPRGRALAWVTRRAERRLLRAYPRQIALTDRLAAEVRRANPSADVSVVPLGIDLSLYPFDPDPPRPPGTPPTVGLIGSFGWTPTILAGRRLVERLWPAIRAKVPQARLLIVGRRAADAMQPYIDRVPGLEVRPDVPDPIPHFRELDVMLYAPPVGSGIKIKVVEAMALGTPVVTNSEGAEGLGLGDGVDAGLADDDAGLADRAAALLLEPTRRTRQRCAARERVADVCGARTVLDRLEAVYHNILEPSRGLSTNRAMVGAIAGI